MSMGPLGRPLLVVVGSGGVGKTTIAAALGVASALDGADTLVMTFDPSRRLKDALGVGDAAGDAAVRVALDAPGRLDASLLDARATFDRLVRRYAPDPAAVDRIFGNPFYARLAGTLAGILEYMAVERLFEVAREGRYKRIILDTPPTRQALDFLQAPDRIVRFLDSSTVRIALQGWFSDTGSLAGAPLRLVGRGVESVLDRAIGLSFLRDMTEFFQAFAPLFQGFRQRAIEVQKLLRHQDTMFLMVAGPAPDRTADAMYFARRLSEAGHRLGPVIVNQVHPVLPPDPSAPADDGLALLRWLGAHDARGVAQLRRLAGSLPVVEQPVLGQAPTGLDALAAIGTGLVARLA